MSAASRSIEDDVLAFLRELDPDVAVGRDELLLEHGAIDSMGLVELVAHLEQRYGIEIADRELTERTVGTVGRIAALVEAKLATR